MNIRARKIHIALGLSVLLVLILLGCMGSGISQTRRQTATSSSKTLELTFESTLETWPANDLFKVRSKVLIKLDPKSKTWKGEAPLNYAPESHHDVTGKIVDCVSEDLVTGFKGSVLKVLLVKFEGTGTNLSRVDELIIDPGEPHEVGTVKSTCRGVVKTEASDTTYWKDAFHPKHYQEYSEANDQDMMGYAIRNWTVDKYGIASKTYHLGGSIALNVAFGSREDTTLTLRVASR